MEKIGIYCRVSSKSQEKDGTSIEYQLRKGREISKKIGMKPIILNEGGKTSWKSNVNTRPQLVKLLNGIESREFDTIWVWNIDRLGRHSDSWYSILKILLGWKVKVYIGESTNPSDFSNHTDRLTIGILTLISTYDNELRRTRMMFGKMETLKKGRTFIGGTIPFGYEKDKNKMLVPHPTEKNIVKKMFEMYKNNKSSTDIQIMLDSSEHKPRRSKRGWNLGTIQKMLGNQLYIGTQEWNWKEKEPDGSVTLIEKIEIKTPKLVSKKLYNDVRKRLNKHITHNQYDTNLQSLLKGLLVCKSCGYKLNHRYREKQNSVYYCVYNERKFVRLGKNKSYNKYKRNTDTCEMSKSLIIEQTDDIVWNTFLDIFRNSIWVKNIYKGKGLEPKFKLDKEVKQQQTKLINQQTKMRKQINQLNDSLIEVELKKLSGEYKIRVYEGVVKKLEQQTDEITKKLDEIQTELKNLSNRKNWIDWVKQMGEEIDKMKDWSVDNTKEKLLQFVKEISVEYLSDVEKHKLNFTFNLPIIDDKIKYSGKLREDGTKDYVISKGSKTISVSYIQDDSRKFSTDKKKKELIGMIGELTNQQLGFGEISNYLNDKKIKTIKGKEWTRQLVRKYSISNTLPELKKKD